MDKEHPKFIFLLLVIILGLGIHNAYVGIVGLLTESVENFSRYGNHDQVTWSESPWSFVLNELFWLGSGALVIFGVGRRMYGLAKEGRG